MVNKKRLISLAVWAAGEDAKRRLGLPSEWNQDVWLREAACGTVCCIAGKVALEDGGKPMSDSFGGYRPWVAFPIGDRQINIEEYAQEALSLNWAQAAALFNADNTLDDVLRIIAELIGTDAAEASS